MVGKESYVGEMGEAESPPPPGSISPSSKDAHGNFCPPFLHDPMGGASVSLRLLTRSCGLIGSVSHLLPCGIHGRVGIQ
jgi:hypothetical protein